MQWQLIPETTMHVFDNKRFTDNDRDQQTYGSDPKKFRKWQETDTFPPPM